MKRYVKCNKMPTEYVQARRWKYTLKCGKELRDAIENDDYEGVLNSLWAAYNELYEQKIIDEDDFDTYTAELEDYDTDDADIEETLDYELSQLYDLCDNLSVWVAL